MALAVRTDGQSRSSSSTTSCRTVNLRATCGLIECNATPESIAVNELLEETGHSVIDQPKLLGCLYPDTGRLENQLWAYFAEVSQQQIPQWNPEIGVTLLYK